MRTRIIFVKRRYIYYFSLLKSFCFFIFTHIESKHVSLPEAINGERNLLCFKSSEEKFEFPERSTEIQIFFIPRL